MDFWSVSLNASHHNKQYIVHGVGMWISRVSEIIHLFNLEVGIPRGAMASVTECILILLIISNKTSMWFRSGDLNRF